MYDSSWNDAEDLDDRLGQGVIEQVKAELDPTECLLWADRPGPPRVRPIPLMPVIFVSVVAGLSGFSLAAMFGLVGQDWHDRGTLILVFGLAPMVLGGMIVAQQVCAAIGRWLKGRQLARLVYALTDHRAVVARIESAGGALSSWSLRRGEAADTRCYLNPDGSGDLYFLGHGGDPWLPFGFLEVPRVDLVEALARETLLDVDQDWWKFGAAGTV